MSALLDKRGRLVAGVLGQPDAGPVRYFFVGNGSGKPSMSLRFEGKISHAATWADMPEDASPYIAREVEPGLFEVRRQW